MQKSMLLMPALGSVMSSENQCGKVLWTSPGRGTEGCGDANEVGGPAAPGPNEESEGLGEQLHFLQTALVYISTSTWQAGQGRCLAGHGIPESLQL